MRPYAKCLGMKKFLNIAVLKILHIIIQVLCLNIVANKVTHKLLWKKLNKL